MQSYWREQMHFHLGALERCPAQQNESPNQTSTTPASAQFPALFTVVNLTVDWFYLPELSAMWAVLLDPSLSAHSAGSPRLLCR